MKRGHLSQLIRMKLGWLVVLFGTEADPLVAQSPRETPVNFKIAFIGDQGLGSAAGAVLTLVKAEGAEAVVHSGDFDYEDNPAAWEAQINDVLGADFPYFASVGNHDESRFYGPGGYQHFMAARMNRLGIPWDGDLGVKSSFKFQGIFFVLTGPDVFGSGHAAYVRDQLAADQSIWSISSWHKNMRLMQVGGKSDEAGWEVYEESRQGGAIIATGHEHSYSRTHLLRSCQNQTVASTSDTLILTEDLPGTPEDEGKTFVFVSGLGGKSIRDQERNGHWWAAIYTATQGANHGALFGTFNFNGVPNMAHFYFKDIDGVMADEFYAISNMIPPQPPALSSFSPASGPYGTEVTISGSNFVGATQVTVGGVAAGYFRVDSNSRLRAEVPAGAPLGGSKISVTTLSGTATSADDFVVTPPLTPAIVSFSPSSGPAGMEVTITGTYFTGATEVAFNGVAASNFMVDFNSRIRAEVPVGATTGKITVTAPGGTAMSTDDFIVTSGLVGHWWFDEGGGTTAADASGNGNDGTLVSGPTWSPGQFVGALRFDGVDDYVDCGNGASLNITGKITVALWAKSDGLPGQYDALLMKTSSTSWPDGYGLFYNGSNEVRFFVNHWNTYLASAPINPTPWNHIAGVYDGSAVRIYVNGVEGTSVSYTGSIISTIADLEIGRGASDAYNLSGWIDEVRLYNRALSAEEIRALANPTMSGVAAPNPSNQITKDFHLSQNYPNPFPTRGTFGNPETVIRYELPEPVHVKLSIYDLLGHKIRTLVEASEPAGVRHINWDGTNDAGERLPSGMYMIRIDAGKYSMARKIMLMK
jgi:hypothetical protein